MPRARRVIVGVPTLRVSLGEPLGKRGDLRVVLRPKHKMPVIGHEAIGQNRDGRPRMGLG
jgi:hypothetical protein